MSDTPPTVDDFAAVGNMSPGLFNANFFLAIVDADPKTTEDARQKLAQALDTCCWDQVAQQIVSNIKATGLTFSGDDLHQAYAPDDNRTCAQDILVFRILGQLIADGQLVGDFFSKSLPDFFQNDFPNFFTDTIGGFFTGQFAQFFTDLGSTLEGGFENFGDTLKNAFQDLGNDLDPTKW